MARRQRAAWGSNEDAGNGRRRIRYWADLGDGRGYRRVSETVTGSRRDADLLLARRRVEHDSDAPVPTLRQAYEAWWLPEFEDAIERGEVKRNTLCTYTSRWRAHLEPAFGSRPVTDIRPLDVQAWLLGMTSNNAKQSIRLLSQVLDVCVRYEVLGANVAASRYRMPRDSARQPAGVLTMAERDRVLEELRGTCAYLPAVLAGVGSCRVGESLAASVAAGDVRAVESHGMTLAVVEIRRQQHHDGSIEESLKNRRSERPVVIPEPWSADVLAAPGPWLCDRGDGTPARPWAVKKEWEAALARLGMERIPFKNLRNSWRTISRWELGMPEDYVERMMGHGGKNVGEIHYDRPAAEQFADVVADAYVRYRVKVELPIRDK